jgi:tetratricopeptide (TPR) repeat protein
MGGRLFAGRGAAASAQAATEKRAVASITVDYPAEGSIFPPEIAAPTFLWRDPDGTAAAWRIDVAFSDGSTPLRVTAPGERMRIGEIDPRCVSGTNELPRLTRQQAASRTWTPGDALWSAIKRHSVNGPASITVSGLRGSAAGPVVSRGQVTLRTSKDPVGAPVFYRDVPLMPSETEKGVIKPLASQAIRLIAWRLRNVSERQSRVVMENLPTCANCHSFSRDGKTLGMDLDGPQNDKGMYTLARVSPEMSIRNRDVIEWSSARGKLAGKIRVGFMSQVSPDGEYVITRLNASEVEHDPKTALADPQKDASSNYYVANFTDYRFLQVFYPTRGILAWYSRATGRLQPLPGADDPRYVQTSAFWSPDGKYLVFGRAAARDANPEGAPLARYSNDPNERQIQYDLYRIPFNDGRGGKAEPIAGASRNGMSNSFPKVSPDGRWIVFVKSKNGQLMRPDGQLYIVPFEGGTARRMRCNTPLMNSWHSFSPNGRWMVFSSKSRSPYTQMYLTHIDENGNDSPAILIDNATAANRAVNLPEFLNIAPDGLRKIETPAVESYRLADDALSAQEKGQYEAAAAGWEKVLAISPEDASAQNSLGMSLFELGRLDPAVEHFQKAIALRPEFVQANCNLGGALAMRGQLEAAIVQLKKAESLDTGYAPTHNNLGMALLQTGRFDEAAVHFRKAVELKPGFIQARCNLGSALAARGRIDEAISVLKAALDLDPNHAPSHFNLGLALADRGDAEAAIQQWRKALDMNPQYAEAQFSLADALWARGSAEEALSLWRAGLRVRPDSVHALSRMAWALATYPGAELRNGNEAVRLAEHAFALTRGQDATVLDALAAAYAEAGRFGEAAQTARTALDRATREGREPLAGAITSRLALYETKAPFREKAH